MTDNHISRVRAIAEVDSVLGNASTAGQRWWKRQSFVVTVVVAAMVLYLYLSIGRYIGFRSPTYDLGFYDQVVQQTALGNLFQTSFLPYSMLGEHWEPILAPLALFDRLVPTPIWLLLYQAIALALAPLFAWRLARRWLGGDSPVASLIAIGVALNPLLIRTATFDFHTEALTPVLALLALDAASRRRRLLFVCACAGLLLLKEDAFLVAAGVGWIAWTTERERLGLMVSTGAVVAFGVVTGILMPNLRDHQPGDLIARYEYLGGSTVPTAFAGAITHPWLVIQHLLDASALHGWAVALIPLLFLPLLSGRAFLACPPVMAIALLSADPDQSQMLYHYGLESLPLLVTCSLLGWRRVIHHAPTIRAALSTLSPRWRWRPILALTPTLIATFISTPFLSELRQDTDSFTVHNRYAAVRNALSVIPANAEVSASTGVLPHLTTRASVFEFPGGFGTHWIALDTYGERSTQSVAAGFSRRYAQLQSYGYKVVRSADGVVVWELQ